MGSTQAMGMAEAVDDGMVDLRSALSWHLTSNHYPPIPEIMIDVAMAAIEAGEDEDWDRLIDLPDGVEHRRYGHSVPASAVIEDMHLDPFILIQEGG
jgi:hypothetical protein